METATMLGNFAVASSADFGQGALMLLLIQRTQLFPVQSGLLGSGRLGKGRQRIDVKISIVGMLLLKVVTRLHLRITLGQDGLQFNDYLLQFLAGELSAKPEDKTCYFIHGGWSPGCRQTTLDDFGKKATIPPFVFLGKRVVVATESFELWKLPLCGNRGKTKRLFFHRSHIAWKTPRKKRAEFPPVPTAPTAVYQTDKKRRLKGETTQSSVAYLKINKLPA
jgi:hypothetical protein